MIAAEDTRHTRKLLSHFDIHPSLLISYHQHNRLSRAHDLLRWWGEGKSVALVSDAGTPGISDPGEDAVALAIEHDVPVIPIPGASAVLAALVASGLPSQPFTFLGFLPRGKQHVVEALAPYTNTPGAIVCYEAPHRVARTLESIAEVMPSRAVALAKELTKRHETFLYGSVQEVVQYLKDNEPRGEYVIVLGPPQAREGTADSAPPLTDDDRLEQAIQWVYGAVQGGMSHTEAVRTVAQKAGVRRKELYQRTLAGV